MAIKETIQEIDELVADVIKTGFVYNPTYLVPKRDDSQLTYESGTEKKGKRINTCVLYVDIRNSVQLTIDHPKVMGKVYTAFTKAVLKAARYHDGHIRNIIGDRVMIVFPSANCFTNAVDCAISINHIAKHIINPKFNIDFNCGIGIDYGEMKVIKVGIERKGIENNENKGLVWSGKPANIASRLTDNANKSITETYFEVKRNPLNPAYWFRGLGSLGSNPAWAPIPNNEPQYLSTIETVNMSSEEFANSIHNFSPGELYMSGGKFISFTKKDEKYDYPPILMTEAVFNGYKSANPLSNDIKENHWKIQKHQIKNVATRIYGGRTIWTL